MKSEKFRFWPVLFIIGIWLVFSHQYLLFGKVPYASTYQVNFFAPWSHYQQFWGPMKNNAMPDVHTQIYPWKKLTIETLKNGQIPWWNPYSFSGNPHVGNYQSAVFSPLNVLFFILPFLDAWSLLVLLQPLLAGLFTFWFVRAIGVSRVGALISSVTFMFSGFMVVWMAYGTLAYAILYLPLALFAIERYISTKTIRFLGLLSISIVLSFFSGHFQISLYFFIAILAYVLFKLLLTKNIELISKLLFASIFGLILSLPQLIPSIKLYALSVRSETFLLGEGIPFQYLITAISPDLFGNPVTRNDWFGHYAEWASFVGILPLMLGIYATIKLKVKSEKLKVAVQNSKFNEVTTFFALLGFSALVLAVLSPIPELIVKLQIPVISTSALSRIIVLFSFSFAVLAGFGLDLFVKDLSRKNNRPATVLLFTTIVFFASTWFVVLFTNIYPQDWLIVAKRNFILPTTLFGLGALIMLASKVIKDKKLLILTSLFLLLASSFDSFRFAAKWMPFDPREFVYPNVSIIDAMKKNIGDGRIFGNLGGEVTTYYGLPSIEGYDPLYIGRYGEFVRSSSAGEFLKGERSLVRLDRRGKYTDKALDLLGVNLIFHPIADTNQGWAYPVWEDKERYSLAYSDDKFQLFRNNYALPRAALFYDYELIGNDSEIIERFYSDDFDFRSKLILEEDPGLEKKEGTGSVQIVGYKPNRIVIDVTTDAPALLFLSDNYYPDWKVKVNGISANIYRADYTFRAVIVPPGESRVEFVYEETF